MKKTNKAEEILGCTFEEFNLYIEKQFDDKMNWNNYGSYWNIDHKKPISLAISEEEIIALNHYTNLRPMFWLDNLIKGDRR